MAAEGTKLPYKIKSRVIIVNHQFPSCFSFVSVGCKDTSTEDKNNLAKNYVVITQLLLTED